MLIAALFALSAAVDDTAEIERTQAALWDVELQLREEMPALPPNVALARLYALDLLRQYAARGVFPHNHESTSTVPIFIDAHGTHCAVAEMLRATGAEQLAQDLAARDNQLLLPIDDARLTRWATAHGFTIADLARVQRPGYSPRPAEDDGADVIDRVEVLRALASSREMRACLASATMSGRLALTLRVTPKGNVAKAVARNEAHAVDPAMTQCAQDAARALVFESTARGTGGDLVVDVPYKVKA